jgi:hypothetical protein
MDLPVLAKLKKEQADLKHELTVQLPKELATAAAHGDLSENAEYEAAKHRRTVRCASPSSRPSVSCRWHRWRRSSAGGRTAAGEARGRGCRYRRAYRHEIVFHE